MACRLIRLLPALAIPVSVQATHPSCFTDDAVSLIGLDRFRLQNAGAPDTVSTESADEAELAPSPQDYIITEGDTKFTVRDQRQRDLQIKVFAEVPFASMLFSMCRVLGINQARAILYYKGEPVNLFLTPQLLGAVEGDTFELVEEAPPPPPPADGADPAGAVTNLNRGAASQAVLQQTDLSEEQLEEQRSLRDALRESHDESSRERLEGTTAMLEDPDLPPQEAGPPEIRDNDIPEKSPYYVPPAQRESMDWRALKEALKGRVTHNREQLPLSEWNGVKPWIQEVSQLPTRTAEESQEELKQLTRSEDVLIQQEALDAVHGPSDLDEVVAAGRSEDEETPEPSADSAASQKDRSEAQEEDEVAETKYWDQEIRRKVEQERETAKGWQDTERERLRVNLERSRPFILESDRARQERDARNARENWNDIATADAEKLEELAQKKEEERSMKRERARLEREEKERQRREKRLREKEENARKDAERARRLQEERERSALAKVQGLQKEEQAEKGEGGKEEAEEAQRSRQQAERGEGGKEEAEEAQRSRQQARAERDEARRAERERAAKARAEEQLERAKKAAEERAERDRERAAILERARADKARAEAERAMREEAGKAERRRLEGERAEAEALAKQRAEEERALREEASKAEQLARQQAEAEGALREEASRAERERVERRRAEEEQEAREQAEADDLERAEQEELAKAERAARERAALVAKEKQLERERRARAKAAQAVSSFASSASENRVPATHPAPAPSYNSFLQPGSLYEPDEGDALGPYEVESVGSNESEMMHPLPNLTRDEQSEIAAVRREAMRDCVLSDWSDWSDCRRFRHDGMKLRFTKRYREVLQPPLPGGRPCAADMVSSRSCVTMGTLTAIRSMGDLMYYPLEVVDRLISSEGG